VYNILCDSVGMEPKPNNGTLRLPLKTIGFHEPGDEEETPEDPVPSSMPEQSTEPAAPAEQDPASEPPSESSPSVEPEAPPIDPSEEPKPQPPSENDGQSPPDSGDNDGDDDQGAGGVWGWIKDKWGQLWDKITGSG
jgi:hypothetical protein